MTRFILVIISQALIFLGGWALIASLGRSFGRFPAELSFGLTIYFGALWIISIFVVCGALAYFMSSVTLRWGAIIVGLISWGIVLWPSFASRPYATPVFFTLGATLLIWGTGFVIPRLRSASTTMGS